MTQLLDDRLETLEQYSYSELIRMSSYRQEKVKQAGKRIVFATWIQVMSDSAEVYVVLQAYRPWFLGIGRMEAKGFCITHTSEIRMLEQKEIYEYT